MKQINKHSEKYIIGVTGGIGCGKTTVTDMFSAKGIDIVDADLVARQVVKAGSAGLQEIVASFGMDVLKDDGELDRARLRVIAFSDEAKKLKLNSILHPLIRREMLNQLANTESQYCLLSAPLLFENKLQALVKRSLVVDITEEAQLNRTLNRDGGDKDTIKRIIQSQIPREERLRLADDVIDNSEGIEQLQQQVDALHEKYQKLSAH